MHDQLSPVDQVKLDSQAMYHACITFYFLMIPLVIATFYLLPNSSIYSSTLSFLTLLFQVTLNSYFHLYCRISTPQERVKQVEEQALVEDRQIEPFCKKCDKGIPVRAQHCQMCGVCVRKFDHHCPWMGVCIGEMNHERFVVSLLSHALLSLRCLYVCLSGLQLNPYWSSDGHYGQGFGIYFLLLLFFIAYFFVTTGLFFYHAYLLATNMTTIELTQPTKCSYLKGHKLNPFDRGLCANLKSLGTRPK